MNPSQTLMLNDMITMVSNALSIKQLTYLMSSINNYLQDWFIYHKRNKDSGCENPDSRSLSAVRSSEYYLCISFLSELIITK